MACFADLSDDVLFMIFSYVYKQGSSASDRLLMNSQLRSERQPTLHSLRLVSNRLRFFAESVIYRTVILQEDDGWQEEASYRIIERILDLTDNLRHHVRFLHVRSFGGDEQSSCMNTSLLLGCIRSISKLDSFRWHADIPLPDEIVAALHQYHPKAQLCVSTKILDCAAVQSTQLRLLSVSMPCSDIVHPNSMAAFGQLRDVMVKLENLTAFSFEVHQAVDSRRSAAVEGEGEVEVVAEDVPDNPTPKMLCCPWSESRVLGVAIDPRKPYHDPTLVVQIPLRIGDRFPPLEDLSILARAYAFDLEHCIILRECMDWSKLKCLRLGSSHTGELLDQLTNKLPRLQHLDLTFHSNPHTYPAQGAYLDTRVLSSFIDSLGALQGFTIRCDIVNLDARFWGSLAVNHKTTLRHLSIQSRYTGLESPVFLESFRLSNLLSCFTNLTSLDLALPTLTWPLPRCERCHHQHASPTPFLSMIPVIATLESLRIALQAHQVNDTPLHPYVADQAHCIIRTFWTEYANSGVDHTLDTITVEYWRWEFPLLRHNENGLPATASINRSLFRSRNKGQEFEIKSWYNGNALVTSYKDHSNNQTHNRYRIPLDSPIKPSLATREGDHSVCVCTYRRRHWRRARLWEFCSSYF